MFVKHVKVDYKEKKIYILSKKEILSYIEESLKRFAQYVSVRPEFADEYQDEVRDIIKIYDFIQKVETNKFYIIPNSVIHRYFEIIFPRGGAPPLLKPYIWFYYNHVRKIKETLDYTLYRTNDLKYFPRYIITFCDPTWEAQLLRRFYPNLFSGRIAIAIPPEKKIKPFLPAPTKPVITVNGKGETCLAWRLQG